MITGHQVRAACSLLKRTRHDLNRRTGLPLWMADRVLTGMVDPHPSHDSDIALRDAFDRAGVEFIVGVGGTSDARLRDAPSARRTV